jgi:hypothetical protein
MVEDIMIRAESEQCRSRLTWFFQAIANDAITGSTHICLYMSLFHLWSLNNFRDPVQASRPEIMKLAKISSSATYHKCLRDLVEQGYIKYVPSCNPFLKSLVYMDPEK